MLEGAEKIRPKKIKNKVISLLKKPKIKEFVKYGIKEFVDNKVTNWIDQVLCTDSIDCITSFSGFAAGIIDYGVDKKLKEGKIYLTGKQP